jgi:phosphoenolpyruvate carboxylase
MNSLLLAETNPISRTWVNDPFYNLTGFSLDLFLALKSWHETLFSDPNYSDLLDIFGNNLLPKTGSRPTKRIVQAGSERRDPSKRRAIPHNAILQQLGFLTNVISGMGSAAQLDTEKFVDLYQQSPRLQQCLGHIRNAKALGSLNTVLAYCRLSDAGFWVNRAYHGQQHTNQCAFRKLGQHLNESGQAKGVRQTIWRLRDDLVDLYRLVDQIGDSSLRNSGKDRSKLDLLHAIRIAVIIDSLVLLCRTPTFAESNNYSNSDLLLAGLRLDFETATSIIQSAFATATSNRVTDEVAEIETYSMSNSGNYAVIKEDILEPLKVNHDIILTITQMVSGHYGAHG